jgi:C_GCAxxG_C_C family probable redox protein
LPFSVSSGNKSHLEERNMNPEIPHKPKEDILQEAESTGYEFEKIYHGCAQCVLGTMMKLFHLTQPEVFKSATGLAGGIGLSVQGSCGALTGGVMAISLIYGREIEKMDDPEKRRFVAYRLANQLQERFVAEYGSSICGEIHKKIMGRTFHLNNLEEWQAFLEAGGHSEKCPGVVGKAARWTAEILLEESQK